MSELSELLPVAGSTSASALAPLLSGDWHAVRAADLTWSCWDTTLHLLDDLYFYACQVLWAQPTGYLHTELAVDADATIETLVAAIPVHAELLKRVVDLASPSDRGFHISGGSDPDGFAAMGLVEVLVHTFDVVRGLNPASDWTPPGDIAGPVLARLFPDAPDGDPADVLLYCCGRTPLEARPRLTRWGWDGTVRA